MVNASHELYERFHRTTMPLRRIPSARDFDFSLTIPFFGRFIGAGDRILDIGCGNGPYCFHFARRGAVVVGIDISTRVVALNQDAARRFRIPNVTFRAGDFTAANDLGAFNVVIASEVLEHLPDDRAAIQRIRDILLPGGRLLVTVPLLDAPLHRLRMRVWGHDAFDTEVGHLRRYSGDDLLDLLTATGLEILDEVRAEGLLRNALFLTRIGRHARRLVRRPVVPLVKILDQASANLLGASQLLVAAQKE